MDEAQFQDLLDRLGGDLTAWPAVERDLAVQLLSNSEQARAALAEARLLREALRSAPARAPAGLLDRIMNEVRRPEPDQARRGAGADDDTQ